MSTTLPLATKNTFYAVEFEYGDRRGIPSLPRTFVRYTLRAGTETLFGEIFQSLPGGDLELGSTSSSFFDKPLTVILPLLASTFSDFVSNGEPFPETLVRVWEITRAPTTGDEEIFKLLDGKIGKVTRNYRGKEGLIGIQCVSVKDELSTPLGIQINAQCPWTLGSEACGVNLPPRFDQATIQIVGNKSVEVFWNVGGAVNGQEYYLRGYLLFDDLRIPIRGWDFQNETVILTSQTVPVSWLGQIVTVVPGCDKTIETCRDRYNNEERFGGSGIKMPAYKPNFETPS